MCGGLGALLLTLGSGIVQAETSLTATWALDLLKRVAQWQLAGPLDFLPNLPGNQPTEPVNKAQMRVSYSRLPMYFEPNVGQTAEVVKFLARGSGYTLFLTADEAVLALRASHPSAKSMHSALFSGQEPMTSGETTPEVSGAVMRMRLAGVARSAQPILEGLEKLPGVSNYFFGNNPAKWRTKVPHYRQVRYAGVYPGIDLVFYGNPRQLEYDFVLAPGADPRAIRLAFEGVEGMRVTDSGDLILRVAGGEVVQKAPQVYQDWNGQRRKIDGRYVLHNVDATNRSTVSVAMVDSAIEALQVGFAVAQYDLKQPLIIDPVLDITAFGLGGDRPVVGDWDTTTPSDLVDKIGVFGRGEWYLDNNGSGSWDTCPPDRCSIFGLSSDQPVAGDWNRSSSATRVDKVGVFRNGNWFLDIDGNGAWIGSGCPPDTCLTFGAPGDRPVAGNWNSSIGLADKIGVFRSGDWFLDLNGNGWDGCQQFGGQDACFTGFGQAGDLPVACDWNGDGQDEIGVFRNGDWFLDNGNGVFDGCGIDRCIFGFGQAGDLPVAGKW